MQAAAMNKAKSLEPTSINGLHNITVYARATLLSAYTNENVGGHKWNILCKNFYNNVSECHI